MSMKRTSEAENPPPGGSANEGTYPISAKGSGARPIPLGRHHHRRKTRVHAIVRGRDPTAMTHSKLRSTATSVKSLRRALAEATLSLLDGKFKLNRIILNNYTFLLTFIKIIS